MNGIFYLPTLGPGGAERVVIRLISKFLGLGFDCHLAVITDANKKLEHLLPSALHVEYLRSSRVLAGWAAMLRLAWRIKPDFIFSTHPHVSFLLLISKQLLPRRTVLIVRESSIISKNIPSNGIRKYLWKWLYFILYRFADAVVCQSSDMADDAVVNNFIPKRKITIIGNPVDHRVISKMANAVNVSHTFAKKITLVSAGRFTPDKGFDILVRAIAKLGDDRVCLFIIGEGSDFNKIKSLVSDLGISDRIIFLGYLDNPYPYFLSARFYIMSSRFEGFPNAVLESLALGTPVIATPCLGGIKELIFEKINGYFANDVTADALALAIAKAIEMAPMNREVVARSVLDVFSDEKVADMYRTLIQRTIEGHCSAKL